jgi:hypothetical protein
MIANTHVEAGSAPSREPLPDSVICWTRQADGSYTRAGSLPAQIPTARIFEVDEDHIDCPGSKLWPKEEAVALIERKIAEGLYTAWRYEVRTEMPIASDPTDPALAVPAPLLDSRPCSNPRCEKGQDGTPGMVKSRRAKYCCLTCRVDVCRRKRKEQTPAPEEKPRRKPRSDKKYETHAQRQYAYEWRKRGPERRRRISRLELGL